MTLKDISVNQRRSGHGNLLIEKKLGNGRKLKKIEHGNLLCPSYPKFRRVTQIPSCPLGGWFGAGVGVGMLRGAGDFLT